MSELDSHPRVNILVVDDAPDKLLALEAILEELGQNVVQATSGREALRYLLLQDFAVILLDIRMPDLDGFETAALIRQRKKSEDTPIIFITAFGDEADVWRGYSLGAVDYILAPVVPEVLRAKVSVFVDLYRKAELIKQQADQRVRFAREQAARAAAEEANRRSMFLAEASNLLARSLDYSATLASAARLPIPALGDVCVVSITAQGGRAARSEVACADALAAETWRSDPEAAWGESVAAAIGRVAISSKPECLPPAGQPLEGRVASAIVAPLVARGVNLGTMTVGAFAPRAGYAGKDVSLFCDLAGRAAIAIDNARLYQDLCDGDRRKDEFLAMLGHELRNPLGAISTALQCMDLDPTNHTVLDDTRGVLKRQVQVMSRLVDDLLDVSRITRGKIQLHKETLDLKTVLDRAVSSMRSFIAARGHQLSVTPPAGPLPVKADATRLEQVLCNLLNNAVKYTEPGGQIWLSAEVQGSRVAVHVKDSGVGIEPDLLPRVFDLFTQADRSLDRAQGGLGIGLTLARSLVRLHDGDIQAFSAGVGQGSQFTVTLPLIAENAAAPAPGATSPAPARPDESPVRRILLVDDNADLSGVMAALLRSAGHEVHVASSGAEALEAAAAFGADIGLIDLGLPVMNGFELAQLLRQQPALEHMLLVAVTGYGQPEDRRRSRDAGFDYHLVKPVAFQKLQTILNGWTAPSVSGT